MHTNCDAHQEGIDILMFKETGMVGLKTIEEKDKRITGCFYIETTEPGTFSLFNAH